MPKKILKSENNCLTKYIKNVVSFTPVSIKFFNKNSNGYKSYNSNFSDNNANMFSPVNIIDNSSYEQKNHFMFPRPTNEPQEYRITSGSVKMGQDIFSTAISGKTTIKMAKDSMLILEDNSSNNLIINLKININCTVFFNNWSFNVLSKSDNYEIEISFGNLKDVLSKEIDKINNNVYEMVLNYWLRNIRDNIVDCFLKIYKK